MDYIEMNRKLWNQKTNVHYNSAFYDNASFTKGRNSLNDIELSLLGDITGKTILHLQCHFGQDTISLNRMGAKVTGIDLSDKSIAKAKELNKITNSTATFICCNLYDLPQYLHQKFDIVFTSYGTIGWLPDLQKWGKIIQHFLKKDGQFIMAEFHPVIWMFDDDFEKVSYRYFNSEPIIETIEGSYTNPDACISGTAVTWNHGLAEVLNTLVQNGLIIKDFQEYDYAPYDCFKHTIEFEKGKYRISKFADHIPMVYSISAQKPI